MTSAQNEQLFQELQDALVSMKRAGHINPMPEDKQSLLTPGEGRLLHTIIKMTEEGIKLRPADLANMRHMSPQALSPVLRKMEEAGLITRRMSQSDRRVSYIAPTEEAKSLTKRIDECMNDQMRKLVDYLGRDDVIDLIRILRKAGDYITEHEADIKASYGAVGVVPGHDAHASCDDFHTEADESLAGKEVKEAEEEEELI